MTSHLLDASLLAMPASKHFRVATHHFLHLRAVAEGIPFAMSAKRFLDAHGNAAQTAHDHSLRLVRALAVRCNREHDAQLLGKPIDRGEIYVHGEVPPNVMSVQSFEDFVESHGDLADFSYAEQVVAYLEQYPEAGQVAMSPKRSTSAYSVVMDLLKYLQNSQTRPPHALDPVSSWFDARTSRRLIEAGMVSLYELHQAIASRKTWYTTLPGIGEAKAKRIQKTLQELLPSASRAPLELPNFASQLTSLQLPSIPADHNILPASGAMIKAANDLEAVHIWLATHAASDLTVKSFWRAVRAFLMWLSMERNEIEMKQVTVEDCLAYIGFLENIPAAWISRRRVEPGMKGWAPFRGQLTPASRQNHIDIVSGMFGFLTTAKYLSGNPWKIVNTRISRKKTASTSLGVKSVSTEALQAILSFIESQPESMARHRIEFMLRFNSAVGLRVSELLDAKLGDIRFYEGFYGMEVVGKGKKPRVVSIPPIAMQALKKYLSARGFDDLESAPAHWPLVCSAIDSSKPVSYVSLQESFKAWLSKAVLFASIPEHEKQSLRAITTHYLRHTFATQAVKKKVGFNVIQAQLGHSDINTTMSIYAKAPLLEQLASLSQSFPSNPD